jgi:GNAT superfamily N-acetyltransferase
MPASPLSVRATTAEDVEQWSELYRGYREFYRYEPDPAVVERVWSWIRDATHEVNAFVVADERAGLVGLAHYRRFSRPSTGTVGLYLDDLFTAPSARGAGVGGLLLRRLARLAGEEGLSVVRWITAESNATARRLHDSVATQTPWVTYDLQPEQ